MSGDISPERIAKLDKKLIKARGNQNPQPVQQNHYSGVQVAWRMITELIIGVGIGFGIGFGLDYLFNTTPWLMILFTFLGFLAGVRIMLQTAYELNQDI